MDSRSKRMAAILGFLFALGVSASPGGSDEYPSSFGALQLRPTMWWRFSSTGVQILDKEGLETVAAGGKSEWDGSQGGKSEHAEAFSPSLKEKKFEGEDLFLGSNWLRERSLVEGYVDQDSLQPLVDPHDIGSVLLKDVRDVSKISAKTGGEYAAGDQHSTGDQHTGDHHATGDQEAFRPLSPDAVLHVDFSDGISAEFSVAAILLELQNERHTCTQTKGTTCIYPDIKTWTGSELVAPPAFDYELMEQQRSAGSFGLEYRHLVTLSLTTGIVVVDKVPRREGFCSEFGGRISTVRSTEWGDEFNVRTIPDDRQGDGTTKKDLAYTGHGIGLHTDNPYRDPMPDYQILHQIDGCSCEGQYEGDVEGKEILGLRGYPAATCSDCRVENYFADGVKVAMDLKEEDPEAFDLLSTIPVRWENNGGDGSSALVTNRPHIELQNNEGAPCIFAHCIKGIRFSAKSGGYAPLLPREKSEKYYSARRKFSRMLHSEKYKITLSMKPGQMVIFDNRRILHARSQIHSPRTPRFVQGCYINRDGLWFHYMKENRHTPLYTSLKAATKSNFVKMGSLYKQHVEDNIVDHFFQMLKRQKHGFISSHSMSPGLSEKNLSAGQTSGQTTSYGNTDAITLGQPVDLLEHGLQTASRAYRGNESADIIVMSLFHDMTESIVPKNHGKAAAALLEPYLSKKALWMLEHHEIFQGYYYFHHFGETVDKRQECCGGHEWYSDLVNWCEHYDQAAFDPGYPSLPLEFFRPYVEEVTIKRAAYWHTPSHPLRVAVTGAAD